uniref:TNFR-Cys domain-containing protein n=1 Tax=Trichobilharzia regenti TaxID=157069 RepID=A0AA85JUY1_TRIRE|nr:unnamed protein product [Trichobilharzia regenti]
MSSNYHKSIHHSLKHTIHCIHRTELLMKLLYFIVLWNSVIAGPMLFHSDTLENKDSLPGNPVLTQTTDVNNVKNSSESTIQTETVTPVTIEETGAIVEIQNETCDDPFEEFVSPVRGTPRCCRKCDVGNGMLRLCSNTENTQCRPCKSGFEFSSVRSATKKCMQCRRCEELHPLAKTRTECTPTTDTICQCEKPFYMSEKEQTCKPCTACKPGEGIVKQCDWNSDTQCQSCPAGFWSAQTVDNVKCIPCQICEKNQILVRECSPTTDTLCCPVNNPNCTHEYALPLGKLKTPFCQKE